MKRPIATILIGLLVVPPASAGQKPGKPIDWQNVQTLRTGTQIVVTVTGGQPSKVRLLYADETTLVTIKTPSPKLPGRVEQFLLSLGNAWPGLLNTGATYTGESLRVSNGAVFDGDQKLVDLADVVQQTSRRDVLQISEAPHRHIGRNILLGVAVFMLVGLVLTFVSCGHVHCDSE